MTAAFSARRRADEFEALVSRHLDTPLTERDAARFADLLEVVSDLRSVPEVTARPEFVGSLRERLMAEADTVLVRQPATPQTHSLAMPVTSRKRERRVAVLLGGAAMVGATATLAVAAQTALPGESLYSVKRGMEAAEVRLASDDASRGRALLGQAETRLSELEAVAAGDGGTEQLIPDTLETFTRQSSDGVRSLLAAYDRSGSEGDVEHIRAFTALSMDRLTALEPQLPESARDELVAAGRTLSDLDLEASTACRGCDGGITATPDFLLSSAPADLLTGLDADELTLETAPISGQDVTGIIVPEMLDPSNPSPTRAPTLPVNPTSPPTEVAPDPQKETPKNGDKVKDGVKDVTDDVTDTTSDVLDTLDGATGGALGGLTGDLDDATGGLIDEVTGTLDGLTGGLTGSSTGGLLP